MCWLSLTQFYSFHICLFSDFSCLKNAFTRHPMAHTSRSDQSLEVSWVMHYDAMAKPVQFYDIYVYQAVSHPKLLQDGSLNLRENDCSFVLGLTITDDGSIAAPLMVHNGIIAALHIWVIFHRYIIMLSLMPKYQRVAVYIELTALVMNKYDMESGMEFCNHPWVGIFYLLWFMMSFIWEQITYNWGTTCNRDESVGLHLR